MAIQKQRSNSTITTAIRGSELVFTVRRKTVDETPGALVGELILDTVKCSAANRERAMFHGFAQRIADKAALSADPKTGKSASPEAKLEAMRGLVEHFNKGTEEWSPARSGDRIGSDELMLARALSELNPAASAEDIRGALSKMTKDQRAALRLQPRVKALIEGYMEEQVAGVDVGEILAGSGLEV